MNVLEVINIGAKNLRQNKIESSKLDSELLLAKVLKKKEKKY